jgi:hypothetical protein
MRKLQNSHISPNICGASAVGIATGYELDGRGSIPGRGKIFLFSTASRPALGFTEPPTQWIPGALSLGLKRAGREAATHLHPVSTSRMVELYLHSPICLKRK